MNRMSRPSWATILMIAWVVCTSGCRTVQAGNNTPVPPVGVAASAEGQGPLSAVEKPIDVETFLAFCDRA